MIHNDIKNEIKRLDNIIYHDNNILSMAAKRKKDWILDFINSEINDKCLVACTVTSIKPTLSEIEGDNYEC